jgi:hypothetical protein
MRKHRKAPPHNAASTTKRIHAVSTRSLLREQSATLSPACPRDHPIHAQSIDPALLLMPRANRIDAAFGIGVILLRATLKAITIINCLLFVALRILFPAATWLTIGKKTMTEDQLQQELKELTAKRLTVIGTAIEE